VIHSLEKEVMSLKGKELKTALLVAALVALYSIAALAAWFAGLALRVPTTN